MRERRKLMDRRRAGTRPEAFIRSIIEHLADGLVIVVDGVIGFANPAAAALFGRPRESLIGMPFGQPITLEGPAEIELLRPDGSTITAELRMTSIEWEGQRAQLVSLRDATDRRRAEERERELLVEQARRAEAEAANQAKSDFLAMMNHELRTPLNAVLGYAGLLDLGIGGSLTAEQHRQIDRIRASSQHLLELVDDLLDVASIESGHLAVESRLVEIAPAAEAAIAAVKPTAEAKDMTIQVSGNRELQAAGDEARIRQIVVNLLTNAVKFSPPGSFVSLDYGRGEREAPIGRPDAEKDWVWIRITDSGIGIPHDQLSRIFEPFVQVRGGKSRPAEGSGLGLTLSRRLARLMHGDVTVRSTPGKGSEFVLWLPPAEAVSTEHKITPRST